MASVAGLIFIAGIVGLVKPQWLRLPGRKWAAGLLLLGIAGLASEPILNPEQQAAVEVHKRLGEEADRQAEAAEIRKERIEAGFDPWDGNHRTLERIIKEALNDPDSYEHDETIYRDQGDQLWVRTRFRARNMMGGVVRQQVMAQVDLDGNVLEILAHQQRGADGLYHDLQ